MNDKAPPSDRATRASTEPASSLGHSAGIAGASALDSSVGEMEWSIRTYNCLANAGILTVRQLTEMTEAEVLRIPNFGRKSLNEVNEVLAGMGLRIGGLSSAIANPKPVGGCAAAVPAGIVSIETPWSRGRKKKSTCDCRICVRSRQFDLRVKPLGEFNRKYFSALYDELCEVEDERDYLQAILDGTWPQSVEILEKRLEKAREIAATKLKETSQ